MKFSPKLAAQATWQMRVRKRPFVLSHGITARCNMQCPFCEYWKEEGKEMNTEEVFSFLDEAHSFGIKIYNAWTVEPLLRSDLSEILQHAKELGLITSLVTNGTLLRRRVPDLEDLDYLSVSVDGINSYQEIRGVPLGPILEGITVAQEAGHQVLMNCVISGKNLHELEDLVHLAQEIGALISFEPLNESKEIENVVWEDMWVENDAKYRETLNNIMDMKKNGYPIINSLTYLKMVRDKKPHFKCHASDIVLHVSSDGTITNCRVHKEPLGHTSQGLENVWEASKGKRRQIKENCSGCLFFGYVENSMLYDLVPEVMAHYRWM